MASPISDEARLYEALRERADSEGWVRDLSFPSLATAAGVGLRSVPRHIERLERRGFIQCVHERGRGRRNSYRLRNPNA